MLAILAIPIMALVNRVRGGGLLALDFLPGRAGWYCIPIVYLCAVPSLGWGWAAYLAGCWGIWATPPWGRWMRPALGIVPHEDGTVSEFEAAIERICGGNAYACFTLRNTLAVLPIMAISPWLLLLGPAQTLIYVGVQDVHGGIGESEIATGAAWGLALAAAGVSA